MKIKEVNTELVTQVEMEDGKTFRRYVNGKWKESLGNLWEPCENLDFMFDPSLQKKFTKCEECGWIGEKADLIRPSGGRVARCPNCGL